MSAAPRRILIHRLGSLGDTAIVLPVFHLLNRLFPDAEKRVLTNFPVASVAAPLQAVLGDDAFASGYFAYPAGSRNLRALWQLARSIRAWGPDIAVYANDCKSVPKTVRDGAYLRLCGARRIYGLPLAAPVRTHGYDETTGLYEREGSRIARTLERLGEVRVDDPADWDMAITAPERQAADALLAGWNGTQRFMSFSPGTKQPVKDWTDPNWQAVFAALTRSDPELGILATGAQEDRDRADALLQGWQGPKLNVCGRAAPRVSAELISRSAFFLGNDSGPMHLAAATRTPVVAVFSRHAKPGIWFPFGKEHRIFYPGLAWSGGNPPICRDADGETSITSVPATQVIEACRDFIARQQRSSGEH